MLRGTRLQGRSWNSQWGWMLEWKRKCVNKVGVGVTASLVPETDYLKAKASRRMEWSYGPPHLEEEIPEREVSPIGVHIIVP